MDTYKVSVELKSGSKYSFNLKDTPENINKAFAMIDHCWQHPADDGYVKFDGVFFRISEVAMYAARKRKFFGLF